ncbi:MAG: glucose-6-phosphate isomerase, partial [Planctomycetota bacterium]
KKAADKVIDLQRRICAQLRRHPGPGLSAEEIADAIGAPEDVETVHHILEHAAANGHCGVSRTNGEVPYTARYSAP